MIIKRIAWLLAVALLVGCGENDPFDPDRPRRNPATEFGGQLAPANLDDEQPPAPPPPADPQQEQAAGEGTDPGDLPPPPPPPEEPATDEPESSGPPPDGERVEAKGGVGKKGRGYGRGPIATPAAAYFSARQQIIFLEVAKAVKMYKGLHGEAPQTHEEFMKEIIEKNQIRLPELRAGHRYAYDPEKEKLMVERPRP